MVMHLQLTKENGLELSLSILKPSKIELPRTPKPNWDNISAAIIGRLVENNYDFQQESVSTVSRSSASVSRRSSSVSTVQPSVDDSDATSNKISKLTPIDKDNIRIMYDGLDRRKMWKLSTGTIVEDKMRDVALDLENEQ